MSLVQQVIVAQIHTVFLGDIVVSRAMNLCRLYSVSVFLGDKFCRMGDNTCGTKTLFLCFVRQYTLVPHTFCVFG